MSEPQSIREYLAELDDALSVRLARRERILTEARAHLEEALANEVQRGASPEQAELRVIVAFGAPQEVAASYGVDGATALGRASVALADLFFRLYGDSWRRFIKARVQGVAVFVFMVTAWIALGAAPAMVILGFAGAIAGATCVRLRPVLALPRSGYARRFLKLEPAVRAGIVRHDPAPPGASQGAFAAELATRARRLSAHHVWWAYAAFFAGVTLVADNKAWIVIYAVIAILCLLGARSSRSSARQQAEGELAALDIIDQVIREANVRASVVAPAVIEQPQANARADCPERLYFDVCPFDDGARVCVRVDRNMIWMWLDGARYEFRGPDRLRELRLCLAAVIAGRCCLTWRELSIRRRIPHRQRRYLESTTVLETDDGPRRATDRYGCRDALQALDRALEERGLTNTPGARIEWMLAPYPKAA